MRFSRFLYVSVILLGVTSCSHKKFNDSEALIDYILNPINGYILNKSVNGVEFKIIYRPTDLMVAQEIDSYRNTKLIDSLREKYNKHYYFNLSLSKNNKALLSQQMKDQQEFGAMVKKLSFGMNQNIFITTKEKDTVRMSDYIYPRLYGLSKNTSMLLIFPKKDIENSEHIKLTIKDIGFQTGEVSFKYNTQILKNEPTLAL